MSDIGICKYCKHIDKDIIEKPCLHCDARTGAFEFDLSEHDKQIRADVIDSCKTVVMETIDNELLIDTLLMRMDKLNAMAVEEINTKKYIVCCPMCDNPICAKGTMECEVEKWKAEQLKEQSNTYTAIVDGVKREFM